LTIITISSAHADTFTFTTPPGSSTSGPVNASATFVTGAGTVTITLSDLQANPTDVAQLISGFDFVLDSGATTGTLGSQAGPAIDPLINIGGGGAVTFPSGSPNHWKLNSLGGGGFQLNDLSGGQPSDLIIGPGGPSGYTNANGSIAANGPHNPFINQTATFVVDITGVTVDTQVESADFLFGTSDTRPVIQGTPTTSSTPLSSVPEPTSVLLLGSTVGVLLMGLRKRLSLR
jgi:hypothetical protein